MLTKRFRWLWMVIVVLTTAGYLAFPLLRQRAYIESTAYRQTGRWQIPGGQPGGYNAFVMTSDGRRMLYLLDVPARVLYLLTDHGTAVASYTLAKSLDNPNDVAVDAAGTIYISDFSKGQLLVLGNDGTVRRRLNVKAAGVDAPMAMACDAAGQLYVAGFANRTIYRFAADGALLGQLRLPGPYGPGLTSYGGLAADGTGALYIADHHTVRKCSADGALLASLDSGTPSDPADIAIDAHRNLYVLDAAQCALRKYAPDGKLITTWGSEVLAGGSPDAGKRYYNSLAVDGDGNVYVTDPVERCLIKYAPVRTRGK